MRDSKRDAQDEPRDAVADLPERTPGAAGDEAVRGGGIDTSPNAPQRRNSTAFPTRPALDG